MRRVDAEYHSTYPIKDQDQNTIGYVSIAEERLRDVMLDFALTPVTVVTPGEPMKVDAFLASPRTQLDTRPREPEPPHHHIGDPPRERTE